MFRSQPSRQASSSSYKQQCHLFSSYVYSAQSRGAHARCESLIWFGTAIARNRIRKIAFPGAKAGGLGE